MDNPERPEREQSDPEDQSDAMASPAEDDAERDDEGPDQNAVEQARRQLSRLREER